MILGHDLRGVPPAQHKASDCAAAIQAVARRHLRYVLSKRRSLST